MSHHRWRTAAILFILSTASAASFIGCGDVNATLEKASEARELSVDLAMEFTKATDAANRAVMADTDETSVAFAHEAEQATDAAQKDVDALGPKLQSLNYTDESRILGDFAGKFKEYRALDRNVLDLAVENTNLKAQRLSFGPAMEASDAFRDALKAVTPAAASDAWHVSALVAQAETTVREIQVLQSPHIANADETVMTRMEKDMATSEMTARHALDALRPLVAPASRPKLAAATTALGRFMELNTQIVGLSRRNSNVRSLALSLDQKRAIVAACNASLRDLQAALARRGHTRTS